MTHVPLCSTKGCPAPNNEEWHRCVVCAKTPIEHHHYPSLGMGGHNPDSEIVAALCPHHHRLVSEHKLMDGIYPHPNGEWHYFVKDLKGKDLCDVVIVRGKYGKRKEAKELHGEAGESRQATKDGQDEEVPEDARDHGDELHEVVGQATIEGVRQGQPDVDAAGVGGADPREPTPAPEIESIGGVQIGATDKKALVPSSGTKALAWENLSDEQLAIIYSDANRRQRDGFVDKCHAVHTYRERHVQHWGESWVENAYELFEESPSRRTLEAYANIWTCVAADAHLRENIGPLTDSRSLMQYIGRKKPQDGLVALETAVAHFSEFREAPTVPALQHRLGEEKEPDLCPVTHMPHEWERKCKHCGRER